MDNVEVERNSLPTVNEEKDYIFYKKLNVIYIDNNIQSQKTVLKHITDTMHITTCDSLYVALELIESSNYDVILCDMDAPKDLLEEFFGKISQRIPIIAISSNMDPKIAYDSAKMGAREYLTKNHKDLKSISKSIHKIYLYWVKEAEQRNSLLLLKNPAVRIILRDLINTRVPITQRLNTELKYNIFINGTIKNANNISANDILIANHNIINSLVKREFINKEIFEQTVACPNCNSVNIDIHYSCDNCENSSFKNIDIITHSKCGKIVNNKIKDYNDEICCTKCNVSYKENLFDFKTTLGFQCDVCKNFFSQPSMTYSCNSCNFNNFNIHEVKWKELYKFTLNTENINKVKNNLFLLNNLDDILKNAGYLVKQYEKFINNEQPFGPFELVAYKDKYAYIFIILSDELEHSLSRIFDIDFASKYLDKEIKSFAIALFPPQEIILKLLKKFNIIPIIKDDMKDILSEISKHMNNQLRYEQYI
jgi:CheY-like chemotaxis protein